MEEIFARLSEIEEEASALVTGTENSRKLLFDRHEARIKAFDRSLEADTEEKIRHIREGLEREKEERLTSLREETQQSIRALDTYYQEHHTALAKDLLRQLLSPERM